MLDRIQKRKESGFTIVEVMIVLAIAGLIILVVFLAVPALQRNSRNQQRNSEASLVGAGVNECLNNRNGVVASCTAAAIGGYVDTAKLRQFTTVGVSTTAPVTAPTPDFTTINVAFGRRCTADGSAATTTGANTRSVALLFNTESATAAAVARCQEV